MTDLMQYVPRYYDEFIEIEELIGTENALFDELSSNVLDTINNQFILTAEHNGLVRLEKIFSIRANTAIESIDFRRQRLINRFSTRGPFTLPFLRDKFDGIIGAGNYQLYVDYGASILYLESSAVNQAWYNEIYITVNNTKPAAMVFINKPVVSDSVLFSEQINLTAITYNYQLGTTWKLGQKPFANTEDKGAVKLATVASVQAALLSDSAEAIAGNITKARINNTLDIVTFANKSAVGNIATVEYNISAAQGITEITNIKLLNTNDEIYTDATVYIPVIEDVTLKHNIRTKEGA